MSEEIYLYPEELSLEPSFNTRLWPLDEVGQKAESEALGALAKSLVEIGQVDSCVCVVDPARPLPHVLVIGHRRRRAIAEINQKRTHVYGDSLPLIKLRVRIDRTGADMFQRAAHSNILVKSLSPIELASLIHTLRRNRRLGPHPDANTIAGYLGLKRATVIQYEKLLTQLDPATQSALHSGLITPQIAFDLMSNLESKRSAIIDLANKIKSDALRNPNDNERMAIVRETLAMRQRIKRPHILKAIQQLDGQTKPISRSRTDIGKLILDLDTARYGFVNGEIRQWARAMFEYIQGVVPIEEVESKFKLMVSRADRGTHTKADNERKRGPKPLKDRDRLPRRDKGYFKPDLAFSIHRKSKIKTGIEGGIEL